MQLLLRSRTWWSPDGVVPPAGLVQAAADAGIDALAITDISSVAGLVDALGSAPSSLRVFAGAEVDLPGAGPVLLFPLGADGLRALFGLLANPEADPGDVNQLDQIACVGLRAEALAVLSARFPGRVYAGLEVAPPGPGVDAAMQAAAERLGIPLVPADLVSARDTRDLKAVLARREAERPRLPDPPPLRGGGGSAERSHPLPGPHPLRGGTRPVTMTRAVTAARHGAAVDLAVGAEALAAALPDARELLAVPRSAELDSPRLAERLRQIAERLGLRVVSRSRAAGSGDAGLQIEPHTGPRLAAALAAELGQDRVARASEMVHLGVPGACRLAAAWSGLDRLSAARLAKAALADRGNTAGPSVEALSFHRLDASDPRVLRAASVVPLLAAVPAALVPGRTLVAAPDGVGRRLPVVHAEPVDVIPVASRSLSSLGYAVVSLKADALTGVLGELRRLGVPTPMPASAGEPAREVSFSEALALAQVEARAPAAVLCARLRAAPGLSTFEIRRLAFAARRRGVKVLPARVDLSGWLPTLEGNAVRLGLSAVLGPSPELRSRYERVLAASPDSRPRSLVELASLTGFSGPALARLAQAGALRRYVKRRADAIRQADLLSRPPGEELPLPLP